MRDLGFDGRTAIGTIIITLLAAPAAFGQAVDPAAAPAAVVADPGPRGGPPGAGGPLPGNGLTQVQRDFFTAALDVFQEVDSVSGTVAGAPGSGLGPRFNADSCAACHQTPAIGGTSPANNPLFAIAAKGGASSSANVVPSFITHNGPIREARFIKNPDGTPDGGVHDLFVISTRVDAPGCNITQPNFAAAVAAGNISFRIPTPVFGLGLVETVPDGNLKRASANISAPQASLGIASGAFNTNGNDGTITRFGWKAQNKSLLIFSGEAYNVEQGVTNEAFPNERDDTPGCRFNPTPEDATHLTDPEPSASPASDFSSDMVNFAAFMRLSAAPTPAPATTTSTRGSNQFVNIGCARCHIPQQTTGQSVFSGLNQATFSPFSDFALHDMGIGLQDQISQGAANGRQFRTAPLWGLGQRLFFLHDGRTANLLTAIEAHASTGSEANQVVRNFNLLQAADRQAILVFLRSI